MPVFTIDMVVCATEMDILTIEMVISAKEMILLITEIVLWCHRNGHFHHRQGQTAPLSIETVILTIQMFISSL